MTGHFVLLLTTFGPRSSASFQSTYLELALNTDSQALGQESIVRALTDFFLEIILKYFTNCGVYSEPALIPISFDAKESHLH